jgi:hypothetical protein
MDYSTLVANLDCDRDGLLFDVDSLYGCLLKLTDRRHRQGRRYPLALILVAIVLFIQKRPQGLFALKGRVID